MPNNKNIFTKKNHVLVIAEIGINHNGNLKIAKQLKNHAKQAGADAVKFQTYDVDNLIDQNTKSANYQKKTGIKNQYKLLKKYQLDKKKFKIIRNYCLKKKITFMSTPFDNLSAEFLNKLGINIFKVSSGDLENFHLLKKIKTLNKKIILSTGMSEFKSLLKTIKFLNLPKNKIFILHCVSDYPTLLSNTYLGYLNKIKKLNFRFGISDHTTGNEFAISSIAMGSTIVEKHITLSKKMNGPDHEASMEVKNLKHFIKSIRDVKYSLNKTKRKLTQGEISTKLITERRLFFSKNILKGKKINYDDLIPLRSSNKSIIKANDYNKVVGCISKKNFKKKEPIKWINISK